MLWSNEKLQAPTWKNLTERTKKPRNLETRKKDATMSNPEEGCHAEWGFRRTHRIDPEGRERWRVSWSTEPLSPGAEPRGESGARNPTAATEHSFTFESQIMKRPTKYIATRPSRRPKPWVDPFHHLVGDSGRIRQFRWWTESKEDVHMGVVGKVEMIDIPVSNRGWIDGSKQINFVGVKWVKNTKHFDKKIIRE